MSDNKLIDIDNINVRDKLKLNCPDFIKQAGISQIDFGSLFFEIFLKIFKNYFQA